MFYVPARHTDGNDFGKTVINLDIKEIKVKKKGLTLRHKEKHYNHMFDSTSDNPEYLSPQTKVIFLRPLQILCGSDDINGIDTDIDENPDNWLRKTHV